MKKMQIVLDEEKVLREGMHDLDKMQALIDEILVDEGKLVKGENGFYYPNDYEDGFVAFMSSAFILGDYDWFLDNVDTWLWYNSDDYPEDACVEDAKKFFLRNRRKTA